MLGYRTLVTHLVCPSYIELLPSSAVLGALTRSLPDSPYRSVAPHGRSDLDFEEGIVEPAFELEVRMLPESGLIIEVGMFLRYARRRWRLCAVTVLPLWSSR